MNILILINQAPNYGFTYTEIGKNLKRQGKNVIYVLDSNLTFWEYRDCFEEDDEIHIFSNYFKHNYTNTQINASEFYDTNLWMMYFSDFERMNIYGLHKKKDRHYFNSLIANLLNFFEELITSKKIDAVLYENVTNAFAYSAYLMGLKYKADYFGVTATALPNRFCVEPHPLYNSEVIIKNYFEIVEGTMSVENDVVEWIQKYYEDFISIEPDYMQNERKLLKKSLYAKYLNVDKLKQINFIISYFFKYGLTDNFYNFQNPALIINYAYFKRNTLRKFRLRRIIKLYDYSNIREIDINNKYLIYPIHFHPEASTSVLAPAYINEYHNIINIANNLPYDYTLLVKEHPSAVGFREIEFYNKIKAIPNVRLVHHNVKAKQLINISLGVITITNTMGYESLIMGKKTYLFGRIFYETHPNCIYLSNFNVLYTILRSNEVQLEVDPISYIQAYYMHTFKGMAVYEKKVNSTFVNEVANQLISQFES